MWKECAGSGEHVPCAKKNMLRTGEARCIFVRPTRGSMLRRTRRGACIPRGAIRCMDRSFCSVAGGRADNERRRNGGHATASHERGNSREGDAAGREPGRAELLRLRTDAEEFAFTQSRVCGDDVSQHFSLRNRRSGPLRGYEAGHSISRRTFGTARDTKFWKARRRANAER